MITIYKSEKNGEFYWKATAKNGNKIGSGGEGYRRQHGALKGLLALKKALNEWDGVSYNLEKKKATRKKKDPQGVLRYPVKEPETTQNDLDQAPDRWQR